MCEFRCRRRGWQSHWLGGGGCRDAGGDGVGVGSVWVHVRGFVEWVWVVAVSVVRGVACGGAAGRGAVFARVQGVDGEDVVAGRAAGVAVCRECGTWWFDVDAVRCPVCGERWDGGVL